MSRPVRAAALLLCILAVCPTAASAKTKDKARDAVSVRLEGASAFPARTVLDAVGVKRTSFDVLLHRLPRIERSELEAKAHEVLLFYQRHGYFEASVRTETREDRIAVFVVEEGAPCHLASFAVVPADGAPAEGISTDVLGKDLPLRVGAPFSVDDYEAAARLIVSHLKEDGRPFAAVVPGAVVDMASRTVTVTYAVRPDERLTVGAVTFSGAPHAEERVLRRAVRLRGGEPYRESAADAGWAGPSRQARKRTRGNRA